MRSPRLPLRSLGPLLLAASFGCATSPPRETPASPGDEAKPGEPSPRARPSTRALHAYFERLHAAGRFAGEVRVVDGEDVLLDARFGPVVDAAGVAIDGPVRAPIGSVTKIVTAATVGRLVDEGALTLDDTLGDLLEDAGPYTSVKVVDVLAHESAFPREPTAPLPVASAAGYIDACLASVPEPRAKGEQKYSNCAYAVLGRALEESQGAPLAELVRRTLLAPLGLSETSFDASRMPVPLAWHKGAFRPAPPPARLVTAAGGLVSTTQDLERLFRGLAARGFLRDETRARLPELTSHSGRTSGYMAHAEAEGGIGIYLVSVADDVPIPDLLADLHASLREGAPLPERTWRATALPTPPDALGACVGRYAFPDVDAALHIVLAAEPTPTATILQGGAEVPFALALADDGELHFVDPEDETALLPFSVMLASQEEGCARVQIRLNAGVPVPAVRSSSPERRHEKQ